MPRKKERIKKWQVMNGEKRGLVSKRLKGVQGVEIEARKVNKTQVYSLFLSSCGAKIKEQIKSSGR